MGSPSSPKRKPDASDLYWEMETKGKRRKGKPGKKEADAKDQSEGSGGCPGSAEFRISSHPTLAESVPCLKLRVTTYDNMQGWVSEMHAGWVAKSSTKQGMVAKVWNLST